MCVCVCVCVARSPSLSPPILCCVYASMSLSVSVCTCVCVHICACDCAIRVLAPPQNTRDCRGAAMVAAATDFEAVGEDDEEDWVWRVVCVYVCVM